MTNSKWGNNRDINFNQALNLVLQHINGNHGTPVEGLAYWNSNALVKRPQVYDGTEHKQVAFTDDVTPPSDIDHIVPLDEDSRDEADDPSAYDNGISIMPASETANWLGQNARASIITWKTIHGTWQWHIYHEDNESWHKYRYWIPDVSDWSEVDQFAPQSAFQYFVQLANIILDADAHAESAAITTYPASISIMPVTDGANWGPNTGQAGHVVTERNGSDGKQTFHQYSNSTSYQRTYTGAAWGGWAAFSMEGHAHIASNITDFAAAVAAAIPSSYATDTEVTNAINAVVDAAPGTLDTLNELAAALGDDANFAATIATALAARVQDRRFTIGDGSATSFNLDHNLNTKRVICQAYFISTGAQYEPDFDRTTVNRVVVSTAGTPLTTNSVEVVIMGRSD